ncbi:MAG: glycosyltransferase family 2 protein [Nitrospirales bacterium]
MPRLVTIGIPTYNRADGYLRQALESALRQTYRNIEIRVSDNCSSDHTEAVVKSYDDPRIVYVKHPQNIGAIRNYNFCLEQAKGEYFLLLHDDDLIDEDFIETCMNAAPAAGEVGIIQTGVRVINDHGHELHAQVNQGTGDSTKAYFLDWFANRSAWYLCNTLYNTGRLKELGGFRSKCNHVGDGVAIVMLAARHGQVIVEEVKASFRKHSGELTFSVKVMDWCHDYLFLLEKMCEVTGDDPEVRRRGMQFFCRLNYNRAKAIRSYPKRMMTYFMVYKIFQYSYPPYAYVFSPRTLSLIESGKGMIRRSLAR